MNNNLTKASLKSTINAPLEAVWPIIRAFDGVENYLPMVSSCHLEINGNQTNRVCSVQMGPSHAAKFVERLDFVDESKHSIGYTVTEGLEIFEGSTGIITISSLSKDICEINFSGTFKGENNHEVKKMAEEIYAMILQGLKKLHER
ncbi:MAG: SRPBCC family protein [Candidatus Nitrosotenuis sp.]|nr:MAG: SRPBCC family protein [Candidatus Nitrosotenuis sp.]